MGSVSRTAQFTNLAKVLKKHYKPVAFETQRTVLEHLLFACCLEDAHYDAAEEAFAALDHTFFDWNEVRVTTISELGEVMSTLPDPAAAANRVKRVLQSIFEGTYSYDLEERRKKNLGPTVKWLEELDGTTPFTVSYVAQSALAGHAIPIDTGTLKVLRIVDLVDDKSFAAKAVPGLERAIAKSKGVEFGSMLHQLGADFTKNPYSPAIRKILLQIDPEAGDRMPQRRTAKAAGKKPSPKSKSRRVKKTAAAAEATTEARPKRSKPAATKKPSGRAKPATKSSAKAARPKPAARKKKSKAGASGESAGKQASAAKPAKKTKATTAKLSKRKPR